MIITKKISYEDFNAVLNTVDFFINDETGNKICPFNDIEYVKALREKILTFSMLHFEDVNSENEAVTTKFTDKEILDFNLILGFIIGFGKCGLSILDDIIDVTNIVTVTGIMLGNKTDYIEVLKDKYKDYMSKREEKLTKEGN